MEEDTPTTQDMIYIKFSWKYGADQQVGLREVFLYPKCAFEGYSTMSAPQDMRIKHMHNSITYTKIYYANMYGRLDLLNKHWEEPR
jgi:hypothetical protein